MMARWRFLFVFALLIPGWPGQAETAELQPDHLKPTVPGGMFVVQGFEPPVPDKSRPAVDLKSKQNGARLLSTLIARGKAQGFEGLLYDNRDRAHSALPQSLFPRLSHLAYSPELEKRGLDYGPATRILLPQPVIGNSSTAVTGSPRARSLPRLVMTSPGGAIAAFRQFESNSLYVYPEHRDHDDLDLFPANWPYTVTSQGSSRSDKPFLSALLMTLAAFPAPTRAALEEHGLVASTLKMILHRNLLGVARMDDYLSPLAHPTAIDSARLRAGRMIGQANGMKPEDIPPMVRLRIVTEDFGPLGGLDRREERLFTTPGAIARLWRGLDGRRSLRITAEDTLDPFGREMTFEWILLRGHPDRVRIAPTGDRGQEAQINLDWHNAYPAPSTSTEGPERLTSRVDIGVFARIGDRIVSAPAFVSVSFPTHQARSYSPGPDGAPRLVSVDYDADGRGQGYDPELFWSAPWTDRFAYDADGKLTGWERHRTGGLTRFRADGRREDGRVVDYVTPAKISASMTLEVRVDSGGMGEDDDEGG